MLKYPNFAKLRDLLPRILVLIIDGAHPIAAPIADDHRTPPISEPLLRLLFQISKFKQM